MSEHDFELLGESQSSNSKQHMLGTADQLFHPLSSDFMMSLSASPLASQSRASSKASLMSMEPMKVEFNSSFLKEISSPDLIFVIDSGSS
jgi:hypothetical protein